jgi:hypothetical protein
MLPRVALVRTDVSEELSTSFIRVTRIGELGTRLDITTNRRTLQSFAVGGYTNSVRTSQKTHYISATESSRLMLCRISGCHGSDYEECRLLGYKNTVRTSQETHYVSTTHSSRFMLCKIWGFHGGNYEELRLLGCYAMWLL